MLNSSGGEVSNVTTIICFRNGVRTVKIKWSSVLVDIPLSYVIQVRQQEHDRAHVMLCDLRTQMNQEKHAELSKQKEMLKRGHEAEFQVLMQEQEEALQRFVLEKTTTTTTTTSITTRFDGIRCFLWP